MDLEVDLLMCSFSFVMNYLITFYYWTTYRQRLSNKCNNEILSSKVMDQILAFPSISTMYGENTVACLKNI